MIFLTENLTELLSNCELVASKCWVFFCYILALAFFINISDSPIRFLNELFFNLFVSWVSVYVFVVYLPAVRGFFSSDLKKPLG